MVLLPPGTEIHGRYRRRYIRGAITVTNGIIVEGVGEFASLSAAAIGAVRKVFGLERSINGRDFWRVHLSDGRTIPVGVFTVQPDLLPLIVPRANLPKTPRMSGPLRVEQSMGASEPRGEYLEIPHQIDARRLAFHLARNPDLLANVVNHIGFCVRSGRVDMAPVCEAVHDPDCAGRFFLEAIITPPKPIA